jgi:zinc protease
MRLKSGGPGEHTMTRKLRSGLQSLLIVFVSTAICFAQSRQAPQRATQARDRAPFLLQAKSFDDTTPYISKLVLRNGLTVLVEEYRSQPLVTIQAHVLAGSLDEPSQGIGVARLLASMIRRGTSEKESGIYRQNVQALGGVIKSSADYDRTLFETVVPSMQWKRALELQANSLLSFSPDPADLSQEANLLMNEAQAALDNSAEFAKEKLLTLAFNDPRLGMLSEMSGERLHAFKRESLIDFYKATYVPSKIVLVISGDVNSSEALNEIARLYAKSAAVAPKSFSSSVNDSQSGLRFSLIKGNVAVPKVLFGYHTVGENTEDSRALEVLNAILGLGKGSILNLRLGDQKKLIWNGESSLIANRHFGYLLMQMEVDPQNIDKCEIALLTEIELLKQSGPNEADMARAFAQLEYANWKRLETTAGRAAALAHYESLGDWKRVSRYIADLKKVKPADIKRVANKYLRVENCSLLEYLPAADDSRNPTTEGVRRTIEGLLALSVEQEREKREKEMAPFMKIPPDADTFKFSEIAYPFRVASILRGPDMFIREDHTAPIIEMGIFFPGGKFIEKKENAGITNLMASMISRGPRDITAAQFFRQLEIYGGKITPVVADDYFGVYFSILSRNFEAGFDLIRQSIQTPNLGDDDVARQKEIQINQVLSRKRSESYPWDLMNQALFGDFSYSRDGLGTEASVRAMTALSLQEWHNEYIKNRKPLAVIIGDTKGTSLATYFVQHFSGSRMRDVEVPEEWVKPLDEAKLIEQNWERNQSFILIGFQAPPEDDEDGNAVRLLESLAGSMGKFSQDLRDKLGIAHSLSAIYEPRRRGGSLIACAIANPGDEEAVFKELKEEIQRIAANPITYRDFRSAMNESIGAYRISNEVRSMQIRRIIESMLAGNGIEGFQNLATDLQSVKAEDISEISQKIFKMEKAVIVRMHGRKQQ